VKRTKLVKGQGLAKILTEENYDILDINFIRENSTSLQTGVAAEEQHGSQQVA
jgi:hypothetical protein